MRVSFLESRFDSVDLVLSLAMVRGPHSRDTQNRTSGIPNYTPEKKRNNRHAVLATVSALSVNDDGRVR